MFPISRSAKVLWHKNKVIDWLIVPNIVIGSDRIFTLKVLFYCSVMTLSRDMAFVFVLLSFRPEITQRSPIVDTLSRKDVVFLQIKVVSSASWESGNFKFIKTAAQNNLYTKRFHVKASADVGNGKLYETIRLTRSKLNMRSRISVCGQRSRSYFFDTQKNRQ